MATSGVSVGGSHHGGAFSIDIKIDQWTARRLSQAAPASLKAIQNVIAKSAIKVRDEAKKKIKNPPKTGLMYKRGRRQHQASAPGESPATDFGHLATSITFDLKFDRMGASIGSPLDYADILEVGSPGGKILPRPYLQPALEEHEVRIQQDILDVLKEHLG